MDSSSFALPPPLFKGSRGSYYYMVQTTLLATNGQEPQRAGVGFNTRQKIGMKSISPEMYKQIFEERLVFFVLFTKIMFTLIFQSGMHLFPLFIHNIQPDTESEVQKI